MTMISHITLNHKTVRFFVIATLLFFSLVTLAVVLYLFLGHKAVEMMYLGKAPRFLGFLNGVIEGQGVHPLSSYLKLADNVVEVNLEILVTSYLVLASFLCLGLTFYKKNFLLLISTLGICFLLLESGYRIFDPFPYYSPEEINSTNHGNLSQYDPILGWKGVPNGKVQFITPNNKAWLEHNSQGFRDIEHGPSNKKAIVFLGDSFTWGYEVQFNKMFVNRLRIKLKRYEVFNLAHRGFGTDQSLLTFKNWSSSDNLALVILMFCENDIEDNNSTMRYDKFKPKFEIHSNKLVLTNVPVPQNQKWVGKRNEISLISFESQLKNFLLTSHFLHDVYFRLDNFIKTRAAKTKNHERKGLLKNLSTNAQAQDITLTKEIIKVLKHETEKRGGELIIIAIPSRAEFMKGATYEPYQRNLARISESLDIPCLDLAPYFKKTFFRTYYRGDMHWNKHGHKIASDAIWNYLTTKGYVS